MVSQSIRAPKDFVFNLYLDYSNWHRLFSLTIKGVQFLRQEGDVKILEVDHVSEGKIIDKLRVISPDEIQLTESQSVYYGEFTNRFESIPGGTRFTVAANINLKGFYKIVAPFMKGVIRKQVRENVVEHMKKFAENPD